MYKTYGKVGKIELLSDINQFWRKIPHDPATTRIRDIIDSLNVNEMVFLTGYTINSLDQEKGIKRINLSNYTVKNNRVLSGRSTVLNGRKGIIVGREA